MSDIHDERSPIERAWDETVEQLKLDSPPEENFPLLKRLFQLGWAKRGQARFFTEEEKHLLPKHKDA